MSLYLNGNIKSLYLNGNIKEAYIGSDKVFSKEEPIPTTVHIGEHDYGVLHIGNQLWTSTNLKEVISDDCKWYNDDQSTYESMNYGLLYKWDDLCDSEDTMSAALKAILPSGWRLPTYNDYVALILATGKWSKAGYNLKSTSMWQNGGNGIDMYGFTVVPAGIYGSNGYQYSNQYSYFWTSSFESSLLKTIQLLYYSNGVEYRMSDKSAYRSVRLVKDV